MGAGRLSTLAVGVVFAIGCDRLGKIDVLAADAGEDAHLDAGREADAPLPPPAGDGLPAGCDVLLRTELVVTGARGTFPPTGPFRPCAVVGGQWFTRLALSRNGERLFGLGTGGRVYLLDPRTLETIRIFTRRRGLYSAFGMTPDGSMIATSSEADGELDVWRVEDGALLFAIDLGPARSHAGGAVAFSADGKHVATAAGSDTYVIDLETRQVRRLQEAPWYTTFLAFSDDGTRLVSNRQRQWLMGYNGAVVMWDSSTGAMTTLETNNDQLGSYEVAVTHQGVLSRHHTQLTLWDIHSGEQLWRVEAPPYLTQTGKMIAASDDGEEIGLVSGKTFRRYRLSDGVLLDETQTTFEAGTWTWSPAAHLLAHLDSGGQHLGVMDLSTKTLLQGCGAPAAGDYRMPFSRDGSILWSGKARFEVATGELIPAHGELGDFLPEERGADGRLVATCDYSSGRSFLLDLDAGTSLVLSTHGPLTPNYCWALKISDDSKLVAAVSRTTGEVDVFDTASGKLLQWTTVAPNQGPARFTADNSAIVFTGQGTVRTVGWRDGLILSEFPSTGWEYAVSGDGLAVYMENYYTAVLVRNGVLVARVPVPLRNCSTVPNVTLSPDGSLLAIGVECTREFEASIEPTVNLYDTSTGALVQTLNAYGVSGISWDNRKLAIGSTLWCRD